MEPNTTFLSLLLISLAMLSFCSSTVYYLDDPLIFNPPHRRNSQNLVSSAGALSPVSRDLVSATDDMMRANYFTFVTLINLSPPGLFNGNVTFLMPDDRLLAGISDMSPDSVSGFLLRHSIPSPLVFETLRLVPSGSAIPSSLQNYMLTVNDNAINNVRVVIPDVCNNVGSTIRCHGIDGVLSETDDRFRVCRPPTNLTTSGDVL